MKNRTLFAILACALVVSFALGATGAISLAKEETASANDFEKGRLIGVLITKECLDLFDAERYFADNPGQALPEGEILRSDSAPYQGRLYAVLTDDSYVHPQTGETMTTKKYVFEDAEGMAYFCAKYADESGTYWGTGGDDAISGAHTAIHSSDAGDSIDLKGTIYVSTSADDSTFYFNPVYQTSTGEVYAMSGQGISNGGERVAGMSCSQTMSDEQTIALDGRSETVRTSVEVSICYMDTPESIRILQFDRSGCILSTQEYAAGDLPPALDAQANAEYIIVETRMKAANGAQSIERELLQPEDDSLSAFWRREDGICVEQYCSVAWR